MSYRVLKAVGVSLAALGGAQTVIFGGGTAENTLLFASEFATACAGVGSKWMKTAIGP